MANIRTIRILFPQIKFFRELCIGLVVSEMLAPKLKVGVRFLGLWSEGEAELEGGKEGGR
jgi:hypothetical protein